MIKGILGLFVVALLLSVGYMVWDEAQLEQGINVVARKNELGSSAFRIDLPADRTALISINYVKDGNACGTVTLKNGIVRHATIDSKDVTSALQFQQGIDLAAYADDLAPCDNISITLMAKGGFARATVELSYADGKVVNVSQPRIWD